MHPRPQDAQVFAEVAGHNQGIDVGKPVQRPMVFTPPAHEGVVVRLGDVLFEDQ